MILASQSPRRRELLEEAGFRLEIIPADIDETRHAGETPKALVERLAREKAAASLAAAGGFGDNSCLVAADTIVWDDAGDVLGKPHDDEAAKAMLRMLSGAVHHVSTGACILVPGCSTTPDSKASKGQGAHDAPATLSRSFVETADVRFYPLTEAEIDAYVRSGEPRDKAGAYGIQGRGRLLIESIHGDFYSIMGLPIARLVRELEALLAERGVCSLQHSIGSDVTPQSVASDASDKDAGAVGQEPASDLVATLLEA